MTRHSYAFRCRDVCNPGWISLSHPAVPTLSRPSENRYWQMERSPPSFSRSLSLSRTLARGYEQRKSIVGTETRKATAANIPLHNKIESLSLVVVKKEKGQFEIYTDIRPGGCAKQNKHQIV